MRLRTVLAGSAIATLALFTNAGAPLGLHAVPQAEAAVSISFSVFYDQLGQYGDWVNYRGSYVFIPQNVDDGWRPYTRGHWVYTRHYGWTWVSEEPFGWATYHYGRWGYADDIGWYWVPGTRWAPAWVSWRRSKGYVVWAPLPPSRHGGVDISISIGARDIPDYYWVAVPTRSFLEPNLSVVVINNDNEIRQVVRETRYVGTTNITNNVVVNNVIDVNVISKETGQKIQPVEVKTTTDPTQAKSTSNQITAFQGQIQPDKTAKPPKVTEVQQVKKVKVNGATGAGTGTDTNAPSTTTAPSSNAPATDNGGATGTGNGNAPIVPPGQKKKGTTTTETPSTQAPSTDSTGNGNAPIVPPGQKKKGTTTTETPSTSTGSGTTTTAPTEPPKKKEPTKKKPVEPSTQAPSDNGNAQQPSDQGGGKKKHKPVEPQTQGGASNGGADTTAPAQSEPPKKKHNQNQDQGQGQAPADQGQGQAPADQGAGKKKPPKGQKCDPSTDPNCPPAQ